MYDYSLHFTEPSAIDSENIRTIAGAPGVQLLVYEQAVKSANDYDNLLDDAQPIQERIENESQRVVEVMEDTGNVDEAEGSLDNVAREQREYDGIQARAQKLVNDVMVTENQLQQMIENPATSDEQKDEHSRILDDLDIIRTEAERFHENAAAIDNWVNQ